MYTVFRIPPRHYSYFIILFYGQFAGIKVEISFGIASTVIFTLVRHENRKQIIGQ